MHKLNKSPKYLNYKLTTLKGMSVPQGFVDGSLNAEEAAHYLGRVGIANGFYEKFALKAVTVEEQVTVTSPSGKTYYPGQYIWGAANYDTWEDFRSHAEESPDWNIQPYSGPEPESEDTGANISDFEGILDMIRDSEEPLPLSSLESLAKQYQSQIDQLAQSDPEKAAEYRQVLDRAITNMLMDTYTHQQVEAAKKIDAVLPMEVQKEIEETLEDYNVTTSTEVNAFKGTMTFTLGADSGIHLGGFLSAVYLSGSQTLMNAVVSKLEQAYIQHVEKGTKVKVTIDIEDLFPGGLTEDAKDLYKNILEELSTETFKGSKQDFAKLIALAGDLSQITKSEHELERGKRIMSGAAAATKFEQLQELLHTLNEKTPSDFISSTLDELAFAAKAREFRQSLDSRNLELQSIIDMCLSASKELDTEKLKSAFNVLDIWCSPLGGKTLSDILKNNIKGKTVDEASLRKELRETTRAFPLTFNTSKHNMNMENFQKYRDDIMDVLGADYTSSFVSSILRGGELSFGKLIESTELANFYNQSYSFGRKKTAEFYNALAENIKVEYEKAGNNPLTYKKEPLVIAVEKTIEEISKLHGNDPDLYPRASIIGGIDQKFRKLTDDRKSIITNYFGTGEFEGTFLEGKARQGVESLITFSYLRQMPIHHSDAGIGNSTHIANLMTYVFEDNDVAFDESLGSFVARDNEGLTTAYLHANILTRGRFIDSFDKKADGTYGLTMNEGQRKVFEERIRELRGIQEVTDKDILNYIATTDDFMNPAFLLASAIRANVSYSDILSPGEAKRFRDNLSVDTTSRYEALHSSMATVNGTKTTGAATFKGIMDALDDENISIGSAAASWHEMKKSYTNGRRQVLFAELKAGNTSTLELLGNQRENLEKLLASGKYTDAQLNKVLSLDNAFENNLMDEFHSKMNSSVVEDKLEQVVLGRLGNVNESGRAIISGVIKNAFKDARYSKGHTGHAMEMLSFLPALHSHLQNKDISDVEFSGDSEHMSSVIKWKSGNKEFMFAKPKGTGGTIDSMVIEIENSTAKVYPYESKMERTEGEVPHVGNPTNFLSSLAELWGTGISSISMANIVALDIPHTEGQAQAYEPKLSLSTPEGEGKHYVATGQSAAHGIKGQSNRNIVKAQ